VVIGNGMMAQAFRAFGSRRDVVVFASGVSDSTETSAAAFAREAELLRQTRAAYPEALLVYFGTCSVEDADRRETPYVRHKLAMESLVAAAGHAWIVFRLPLALGPIHRSPTLANFLHGKIARGESFEIWGRSTRYPIDVEDVVRIVSRLIADRSMWRHKINVALRSFHVIDFVRILERITGRSAVYQMVEKGAHYELRCPEVAALAEAMGLDRSEAYLERVLRKYFEADRRP
jgi:nucleoside-diphosphate-sugar epimerase